jgi:hypothetical protein
MPEWRMRIKNRFSVVAIAIFVWGGGMNLIMAFAPSNATPFLSKILVNIGFILMALGFLLFIISIFIKKTKDSILPSVYMEISMTCHIWKSMYFFSHYPEHSVRAKGEKNLDVWEGMRKQNHPYTDENWVRYRPLFVDVINRVNSKLVEILSIFSTSIDDEFKADLYSTIEQLKVEQRAYLLIPELLLLVPSTKEQMLNSRFEGVIDCLAEIDRKAGMYYRKKPKIKK